MRRWQRLGVERQPLIFGVGAAKSGTHSLYELFGHYRSAHEPEADQLCNLIVDLDTGAAKRRDLFRYLREKDERLALEVDSSQLNGLIVSGLARLYPTARFVLTVREPRGWLDSFYDHHLGRDQPTGGWKRLIDHRWSQYPPHQPAELVVADNGFPSIAGRLREWRERIDRVLEAVPAERLLVVRTDRLSDSTTELAAFAGVRATTLDVHAAHAFVAPQRFGLLSQVDSRFVDDQVERWCQPYLASIFGTG